MQHLNRPHTLQSLLSFGMMALVLFSGSGCSKSMFKDSFVRQQTGLTGPQWTTVRLDVLKRSFNDHVAIVALAVDPTNPDTLYASTEEMKVDGLVLHLIKTTDGGVTWTKIKNGIPLSLNILCIAIDPQIPSTVYVGTLGGGLYKSMNAGTSWASMSTGMKHTNERKTQYSYPTINALAIDPKNATTIFAATRGGGIYKSTNGAANWDEVNSGLSDGEDPWITDYGVGLVANTVAIDPTNPQIVYAATKGKGVFKSTDGGRTWTDTLLRRGKDSLSTGGFMVGKGDLISVMTLAINPKQPTTIYAGTEGAGVYKSSNAGATWVSVNGGLGSVGTRVRTLTIDSQNSDTIYGGTQRGVIRTLNGGQSWEFINFGLQLVPNLDHPYVLALDPLHPHTMYVGTTLFGMYRSSNITAVE